jgi:hypothetical protein
MADLREPRRETLRPYTQIWRLPFRIYSIDNMKLPIPINPWDAGYFLTGILMVYLFTNFTELLHIPFYKIPIIARYSIIPYLVLKFFQVVKPDGKKPHRYFIDRLIFAFKCKEHEKFKPIKIAKPYKIRIKIRFRGYKEG